LGPSSGLGIRVRIRLFIKPFEFFFAVFGFGKKVVGIFSGVCGKRNSHGYIRGNGEMERPELIESDAVDDMKSTGTKVL
jgi:hypothetical protein